MTDLGAEDDPKLHALRIKRIIATIIRREPPKPGEKPKPLEPELLHAPP